MRLPNLRTYLKLNFAASSACPITRAEKVAWPVGRCAYNLTITQREHATATVDEECFVVTLVKMGRDSHSSRFELGRCETELR